jgi:hypothetical protein
MKLYISYIPTKKGFLPVLSLYTTSTAALRKPLCPIFSQGLPIEVISQLKGGHFRVMVINSINCTRKKTNESNIQPRFTDKDCIAA